MSFEELSVKLTDAFYDYAKKLKSPKKRLLLMQLASFY